jgi:hypothetical protein
VIQCDASPSKEAFAASQLESWRAWSLVGAKSDEFHPVSRGFAKEFAMVHVRAGKSITLQYNVKQILSKYPPSTDEHLGTFCIGFRAHFIWGCNDATVSGR